MHTQFFTFFSRSNLQILGLSVLCVAGAFGLGIQSAGEVQPITLIEAGSIERQGDVDGSGRIDIRDAIAILEIVRGYREVTPEELQADPNGDGILTVDDALQILQDLSIR